MKLTSLTKLHHYNQIKNLNKLINNLEREEIRTQLLRAEVHKNRLVKNIYKEYESYLKTVRDLIFTSVLKTIYRFCTTFSINDNKLNTRELFNSLENKISYLINSQLPLITIEQLKINDSSNTKSLDIDSKALREVSEFKNYHKDSPNFEDYLIDEESLMFNINKDISYSNEYYRSIDNKNLSSIDLDCRDYLNDFPKIKLISKIDSQNPIITSLLEILEESIDNKLIDSEDLNNYHQDISTINQNLNCFELIDNSLANLLLNLSYKINLELYESKIIKKLISENTFKLLANKKFIINHPIPFIIEFNLNENQSYTDGIKLPSIYMFNISSVELEFKHLNLSIHRNKINELKNKFKLLTKKEKYWRQKEINLNKILK